MLYLLFDAQPPRITPYTARLVTAKMNTMPMSMFGAMMKRQPPGPGTRAERHHRKRQHRREHRDRRGRDVQELSRRVPESALL